MIKDRKEKLAERAEGAAKDKDQRVDPKEEAKDANHILEVKKREEQYPPRMQTRHSQKDGNDLEYFTNIDNI